MKKNLSTSDLFNLSQEDAKMAVKKCWENIEKANPCKHPSRKPSTPSTSGYTKKCPLETVRVFVSSTFKDFFSEREILVKQVFPELREWCHKRGISIIDVDLRWGVPPEKSCADTISICFEELQRCTKESNSYPFFIGLIGERYGWIPDNEAITDEIQTNYSWVKNVSITHMEILHGAFWQDQPNPNATFFFRDHVETAGDGEGKENCLPFFVDNNNFSREHLKELKNHIRQRYPANCIEYSAEFDGYYENEQVRLKGLEDFAEKVTIMLMSSIEHQLSLKCQDAIDPETRPHLNYVLTSQKQNFVGREKDMELLRKFVSGAHPEELGLERCKCISSTSLNKLPARQDLDLFSDRRPFIWVTGPRAVGKSALLARFVAEMKLDSNAEIFYHFERAAPDSSDARCLLRRLLRFMNHPFARGKANTENFMRVTAAEHGPSIISQLEYHMQQKKDKKFILLADGIDQMPDLLEWLPTNGTVKNCFAIVSGDSNSKFMAKMLGQNFCYKMNIEPLTKAEQFQLVEKYFKFYGKHLTEKQTKLLLKKDRSPDWLSLALEELRVFGVMQKLNQMIEALPDSLEDLAWDVMCRLIKEDSTGGKLIEKVFKFLACCEQGLHESGILALLGNCNITAVQVPSLLRATSTLSPGKDSFAREEVFANMPFSFDNSVPYISWAKVQRSMRAFLRINSDGTISFSSPSFKNVVLERLLSDELLRTKYHELLAIYFSKSYSDSMNFWQQFSCLCQLAYQLSETENSKNLLRFYRKDPRANKFPPSLRLQYFIKKTCQAPVSDIKASVCTYCLQRFVQQCILCKSSVHMNEGFPCVSISANARHSACFNPTPLRLCADHAEVSQNRCILCGDRNGMLLSEAYICCECAGPKTDELKENCCYCSC